MLGYMIGYRGGFGLYTLGCHAMLHMDFLGCHTWDAMLPRTSQDRPRTSWDVLGSTQDAL